jgi:glycosyltransferase involved in cell wall biosynthesis
LAARPPPSRRLRIAVLTSGRFHLCDLARELDTLGHHVRFYSLVPPWRTGRFGLPGRCSRWLLPWVAHWAAAARGARRTGLRHWAGRKLVEALDGVAARVLEPCDVFIGMSGMCNRVAAVARRRYGAKIWIERGSRHILSQKAILDAIPGADTVPDYAVRRELADYGLADTLVVLSRHCEQSFLEHGVAPGKLFRNPLGVKLDMFAPTPAPPAEPPTVITVGGWSLRKGCDVLLDAWRRLPGTRLVHVGPVGDGRLPQDPGFVHQEPVDQSRLRGYYARAQVFALASREEGLATVIPQALACGLRVVCTTRTGGEDLKECLPDPTAVRVVPPDDAAALAGALNQALRDARAETGVRDRLGAAREELSWSAYARRYNRALEQRV